MKLVASLLKNQPATAPPIRRSWSAGQLSQSSIVILRALYQSRLRAHSAKCQSLATTNNSTTRVIKTLVIETAFSADRPRPMSHSRGEYFLDSDRRASPILIAVRRDNQLVSGATCPSTGFAAVGAGARPERPITGPKWRSAPCQHPWQSGPAPAWRDECETKSPSNLQATQRHGRDASLRRPRRSRNSSWRAQARWVT